MFIALFLQRSTSGNGSTQGNDGQISFGTMSNALYSGELANVRTVGQALWQVPVVKPNCHQKLNEG
jgi:hypothetical protein